MRQPGRGRLAALAVTVLALFVALATRLGQMELGEHASSVQAADAANTATIVVPAVRGRILDRRGIPLASNGSVVAVTVERATLLAAKDGGRSLVTAVARALGLPFERLWGRTSLCGTTGAPPQPACWNGSPYVPIPLADGVDPARALALVENPATDPGIALATEPVRAYPAPDGVNLAHVLGYIARPTRAEVTASRGALTDDSLIGRAGLEEEYDAQLRGTPGRIVVALDPRGVVTREISRVDPVPGRDLVTSIDVRVQAATEKALAAGIAAARRRGEAADSGSALVLDTRTGAVVASASWPTYDPSVWTGGISSADYARLTSPANGTPLLPRAVAATYPPASTFKAISLQAAVAAGSPLGGTYSCPPSYTIGNRVFHNFEGEQFGRISLQQAIEVSCDTVFYDLAYRSWQAQGGLAATTDARDPFVRTARAFGLGRLTGIDLPGESAGRLPDRAWKRATWEATKADLCTRAQTGYPDVARTDRARAAYLKQLAAENCATGFQFRAGDEANFAIGQGDTAVTPIQMARAYAAVANGGTLLTPRVGVAFIGPSGVRTAVAPGPRTRIAVDAAAVAYLQNALRSVVTGGTAEGAFAGFPGDWPVSGKTGTGEVFGEGTTAWFVSYAPSTAPRYAVAVVISQGGTGAAAAAPVSRQINATLRTLH